MLERKQLGQEASWPVRHLPPQPVSSSPYRGVDNVASDPALALRCVQKSSVKVAGDLQVLRCGSSRLPVSLSSGPLRSASWFLSFQYIFPLFSTCTQFVKYSRSSNLEGTSGLPSWMPS